ncbi:M14 family zinc carboxypeptidase [Streptomyces stelliscabiei]|nr:MULTISPECIES: M14 family zinc carboxypeptidase [Streptomyces]KND46202.1 dehydrogenase [Streptomyces stelliscabiei]MDX2518467.1 M14 family zinc carboxypeptidase [Streptomyces stelliscabiei]MDX2551824.1 M14 family zinc carboxypeptidase [Streptomyces stelliscabiei]MDX2614498.1 M14 family zinc carboxypeptidase [Streptomyces stelliscabiei]MDX2636208.1 M14 family zinc carboxypeptidase [Streptomyces stelliscabiei]
MEVCALPPLLRYPTVDELSARAATLVDRHPHRARLRRVGTSRAGTPMWLLSVGRGGRHTLVVAGPHANEPVGGATVLRLAERVLADPRLSEGADTTWNLLLSLDPDGSRRNEGWLSGPYTLGHHFRHFFRPGFLEQPEWLPDGAAGAVMPETRALLDLQDELRPFFQCSLHGVDVGGGFVELTRDLPGLDRRVACAAARLGIPRELSPYDTLYWPRLGPAVYRIPPPRRGDLAAAITEAAVESTWYHPHHYGTVTAVVEAPMWGVSAVEDGSPSPDADAVLRRVSCALRRDTRLLEGILGRVRTSVCGGPDAARFLAPVDDYLLVGPGLADSWDPDVHDVTARPLPPLDTARLTTLAISGRRVALRTAGLLHQLVTRAGRDPADALPELDRLVEEWCADYRDGYRARWIPVARQAEYQTRVVLAAFGLASGRPDGSRSGEPGWSSEPAVPMHRE